MTIVIGKGPGVARTLKASECKAKFLGVLDEVANTRERVVVTKNGKPVAEIVPFVEKPRTLRGVMKESITIFGDLDDPLGAGWHLGAGGPLGAGGDAAAE
jgi:prevent-host-death family protein